MNPRRVLCLTRVNPFRWPRSPGHPTTSSRAPNSSPTNKASGSGSFVVRSAPAHTLPPGIATTLQIPFPLGPGETPRPNPWQGWVGATPGTHILIARTTCANGTQLETAPITIHVRPAPRRTLQLTIQRAEGNKLQFALIDGAISMTGFTMQRSHDLKTWEAFGEFSPGAVTAFFETPLDSNETRPVFFRAIER